MTEWTPVALLANLRVETSIGNDEVALAPVDDDRVQVATGNQPKLRSFLESFTDEFGNKIFPTVLMFSSEMPPALITTEAVAGFRNLIAVSTIPHLRANKVSGNRRVVRLLWAELFDLYPWMLDKWGGHLLSVTLSGSKGGVVEEFRGQCRPAWRQEELSPQDLDPPLFFKCLERWKERFTKPNSEPPSTALFRSLGMAFEAMKLPGEEVVTSYDVGRLISLCVSAFEILVHPGGEGQAKKSTVFKQLDAANWISTDLGERSHNVLGEKNGYSGTIASALMNKLYGIRNDYLHGNPVEKTALDINGVPALHLAVALYRMALFSFLDNPEPVLASTPTIKQMALHLSESVDWRNPQLACEQVIGKAKDNA